jgi:hypothetical protein
MTRRWTQKTPNELISELAARIRKHALWDTLLLISPPLLVMIDLVVSFYRRSWFDGAIAVIGLVAGAATSGLAGLLLYRSLVPSLQSTAQLMDRRADAQDRFLTLATIDPQYQRDSLVSRLSQQAVEFGNRIEPRRDFPYRIKGSFYWSLTVSALVALMFHWNLALAPMGFRPPVGPERLRELAQAMARQPALAEVARALDELAVKLDDPRLAAQDKQKLIEELQTKIDQGKKTEERHSDSPMLGEASATLRDLQQQVSSGQNQKDKKSKGGSNSEGDWPSEKSGKDGQRQGNGGDRKGDVNAQMNESNEQGKSAGDKRGDQAGEQIPKNQGSGKGGKPQKEAPDREKGQNMTAKTQGDKADPSDRHKSSEDIPQGAPVPERFYQPGLKGKEGIKDARYVTVQLPEEAVGDFKADKAGPLESGGRKAGAKIPLSNVPLPAHVPDAPTEKQQVPLQYRRVFR